MKAKKLLAILASLCMLLTMVPAIAVVAEDGIPAKPEANVDWVALDKTTVTGSATGVDFTAFDKATGTLPQIAVKSIVQMNVTPDARYVTDSFVARVTAKFAAGYEGNGLIVTLGEGAAFKVVKDNTAGGIFFNDEVLIPGGSTDLGNGTIRAQLISGVEIAAVVYPNATDSTLSDVDWYYGGVYISTMTGVTVDGNMKLSTVIQGYGDTLDLSNISMYNTVADPEVKNLPAKPEGNLDLAVADDTVVSGSMDTTLFDKATASYPNTQLNTSSVRNLVLTPDSRYVSDNYVVTANVLLNAGWANTIAALTAADGAVLHFVEATGEVKINDTVVATYTSATITGGDGVNLAAHVNGTNVDFYVDGDYVGSVTDVTPSDALTVGTSKTQYGDYISLSNVSMYNVEADPEVKDLPAKPETNVDLAVADSTVVSGSMDTTLFDKATASYPNTQLNTSSVRNLVLTPDSRYISNNYVISGNVLLNSGWANTIAALTAGEGAVLHVVESTGEVKINDTVVGTAAGLTSGDGVNFAAHVNGTNVDFYIDGLYVGSVADVTPSKALTIGTSKTQYGDYISLSNVSMYNVEADPEVKNLPAKPETNVNMVTSSLSTVTGPTLDGNAIAETQVTNNVVITVTPDNRLATDNYVVSGNILLKAGWDNTIAALTVGEGAVLTAVKAAPGEIRINDQVVVNDARDMITTGDGVNLAAHVNGTTVDFYVDGTYVGTVTDVVANGKLVIGTTTAHWGDYITMTNLEFYNVEADPEFKTVPVKPEGNMEFVGADITDLTASGNNLSVDNYDVETNAFPKFELQNNVSFVATPDVRYVGDKYVVSGNVLLDPSWTGTIAALTVGEGAVLHFVEATGEVKINDEVVTTLATTAITSGDGVNFAASVDGTTVEFFIDGVYVGSVADVTPSKTLKIGTSNAHWGDQITLSNFAMYNVEADPEVKSVPSKPEGNIDFATSEYATVTGVEGYDKATASAPKFEVQGNVALVVDPDDRFVTDNYVIKGNILLADGWNGTVAALTAGEGAVLKVNKDTATGGDVLINDTIVATGKRTALVNGDGLAFAAHVNGTTVDFYIDGVLVGTVEDITASGTLKIGTSAYQWGDWMTLTNISMYNVEADPEVKVIPSKPADNKELISVDDTTLTGIGTGMDVANFDRATGSLPKISLTSGYVGLTATPHVDALNDEFVVKFTALLNASHEANGAMLVLGDGAVMKVVKDVTTGGIFINDVAVIEGGSTAVNGKAIRSWLVQDGAELAAHVYPNADDATLSDIDWYYAGICVATTEGVATPTSAQMRTVKEAWGDAVTFSNFSIYNVEADPVYKSLPGKPETNTNWADTPLSSPTFVGLGKYDTSLTYAASATTFKYTDTKYSFDFGVPSVSLSTNYVVKFDLTGNSNSNGEYNGINVVIGDLTVALAKYSASYTFGETTETLYTSEATMTGTFAFHVNGTTVDIYMNGVCLATVEGVTVTVPTLALQKLNWGGGVTLSNILFYNVEADPIPDDVTVTVTDKVAGGTATGTTTVPYGTSVTVTATAKSDLFTFVGWTKDGGSTIVSTDAEYTLTPAASMILTPVFSVELPAQGENASVFTGSSLTLGHTKDGNPATYDAETDTVTLTGSGNGESFATIDPTGLNGADYVVEFSHKGIGYTSSWGMRVCLGDVNANTCFKFQNNADGITYTDADGNVHYSGITIATAGVKDYALYLIANEDGTYDYFLFQGGVQILAVGNQPAPTKVKFDQQGLNTAYAPTFTGFNVYSTEAADVADLTIVGTVTGGTATGPAASIVGNTVTITATPDAGYAFAGWLKDDGTEYVSTDASYTFVVDGDATYTPVFAEGYTVEISWTSVPYTVSGINGVDPTEQLSGTNSFGVFAGTQVTITMILDDSKVAHFKDGNNGWATLQLNNPVYTIETIDQDYRIVLQPDTKPYVTFETEGNGTVDAETGYFMAYTNITATPDEGWLFSHYEVTIGDNAAKKYFSNPLSNPARNGQTATIKAVFIEGNGFVVRVDNGDGAMGEGAIDGEGWVKPVRYGGQVTLTATAAEGYAFAYWKIGNRIYTDETFTWTVRGDVVVTPVFRPVEVAEPMINFFSADGRLIKTMTATELYAEDAVLPDVPFRYGYTDGAWDIVLEDGVTADTNVYPTYTKAATTYTVTVEGGNASANSVQYETKVTVTATIDGFVAWVDEDGNVLSTDTAYTFFVTRDVTLKAVTEIADETPDYSVVINPTSANTANPDDETKYTITLTGEVAFSSDYRLVECGFVYVTATVTENNINKLVIDGRVGTRAVRKVVSAQTGAGQFLYNLKNAPKSATITARSFMVLENIETGEQVTVYSGLCDASWAD